ncbi:MAG: hypothetical protein J5527_06945 [Treponema sp.]|nr:hypothetical protein [Treponema sp.]
MKKTIVALSLIGFTALAFLATGCTKKEISPSSPVTTVTETKPEPVVTEEKVPEPVVAEPVKEETKMIPGVMLWDEASFWYEKPDGKMYWKLTVDYGTAFECYPKESADSTNSLVESKNAIRVITSTKEEAKKEFTKIRYQNNDYWVQTAIIAINAVPAVVVKDNTYIYKAAEIDKITKDQLSVGTILALYEEDTINGFSKISARPGTKLYEEVFIKEDKLSNNTDDIRALNMVKLIKNTKEKAMQLELLDNTKNLNVSPEIQEVLGSVEDSLVNGTNLSSAAANLLGEASSTATNAANTANDFVDEIVQQTEDFTSVIRQEPARPRIIDDDAK